MYMIFKKKAMYSQSLFIEKVTDFTLLLFLKEILHTQLMKKEYLEIGQSVSWGEG